MAKLAIAVIDYGAGNLHSVAKAFDKIGYPACVTADPISISEADAVVLPGVGAALDTVNGLTARDLTTPIRETLARGKPFLGVCIGLQVLFERTEEEDVECLGLLAGRVRRLPSGQKVPHMGWNQVLSQGPHPLLAEIPDGSNFYFVHSYFADPGQETEVIATTDYGIRFPSVVAKQNLVATQFHPEKSGALGLQIYRNFVERIVRKSL